ncbi:MAG: alanine racemase, partial [Myxococcota bacterium]|nr:alanine racemase [Myxococcota bacterium]
MNDQTTWVEISRSALQHNLSGLRRLFDSGHPSTLAPVIKANAYGHGLCAIADACIECGCDVLCINEVEEGKILRAHGVTVRLYVVGPTFPDEAPAIIAADLEVVVFSEAQVRALAEAAGAAGATVGVHVKIETGTHRQGLPPVQAKALIQCISDTPGVVLAGVTTHLADVEDETEHTFARTQLERFERATADVPA